MKTTPNHFNQFVPCCRGPTASPFSYKTEVMDNAFLGRC